MYNNLPTVIINNVTMVFIAVAIDFACLPNDICGTVIDF